MLAQEKAQLEESHHEIEANGRDLNSVLMVDERKTNLDESHHGIQAKDLYRNQVLMVNKMVTWRNHTMCLMQMMKTVIRR